MARITESFQSCAALLRRVVVVVLILMASPVFQTEAQEGGLGRELTVSLGVSGGAAYGDPFGGGYLAVRLPSEGLWALGADGNVDLSSNERYYGAFATLDRDLRDVVTTGARISLSAGARAGVVVEHDDPEGRNRLEPYPAAGVYGSGAWYFAPRTALETRISIDIGGAPRFGGAVGIRFGR